MPYQSALSVVAPVRDGAADELDRLLAEMGNGIANGEVIDFGALSGVHFARIVVVPADTDHRGRPLRANIVYLADLDVLRRSTWPSSRVRRARGSTASSATARATRPARRANTSASSGCGAASPARRPCT